MAHRYLLLLLPLILGACTRQSGTDTPSMGAPMGIGSPDDPSGRQGWYMERVRNPLTGSVPADIRSKELAYAAGLPKRNLAKSLDWTWRGPRNQGGRTRALALDVNDPQTILAGGVTGGMWRSTDGGATWTKTTAPLDIQSVSCVVQDPRPGQTDTWYYGTGENYGIVSATSFSALLPGDGIFKSTNGGLSWQQLPSTIAGDHETYTRNGSFKQVNRMVVDHTDLENDVVLAAVFNGIFRSADGGDTWAPVLGLDTTVAGSGTYTELGITSTGVFYGSISRNSPDKGFYRSTDGINWTAITPDGLPNTDNRTVLAIDPSDEDRVYWFTHTSGAGTFDHTLWRYDYLSGDGTGAGGEWTDLTANLPAGSCTGYFDFDFGHVNSQSGYDMCLAVHPTDPEVIFLGGTNVYRSTDGFTTPVNTKWVGGYMCTPEDPKDYVYPGHHPDQHAFAFTPGPEFALWSAHDGGLSISFDPLADSVQWLPRNSGYVTTQFYTVHIEGGSATNDLVLGGTQDNGCWMALSDDAEDGWAYVHIDDGAYSAIPQGQDFILTSSQLGRLYKKPIDAQANILGFERIDPVTQGQYNFIHPFVMDPLNNTRIYWPAGPRLWRNDDIVGIPVTDNWYERNNTNWTELTQVQLPSGQRITCLDMSMANTDLLVVGTSNRRIHRIDGVAGSDPVRTEITPPDQPIGSYISCAAPNHTDAEEWVATVSNYGVISVYHTSDGGDTWTAIAGNLEENPDGSGSGPAVFWAMIYENGVPEDKRYFVGTSTGLYSTALLAGMNTVWEQEGPGNIGHVPVNMVVSRPADGLVVVGTHGNGVYSSRLPSGWIGVEEQNGSVGAPTVWPNPATDAVQMQWPTATSPARELRILAIDGSLVSSRELGHRPDDAPLRWDLRDRNGQRVPAGTYLLQLLRADGSGSTARLVVP